MMMLEAGGASIPALGLGTWTLSGRRCTELVAGALAAGYRHVDTAAAYDNEAAVGEAVRHCGLPREQIHVTTKVWHTDLAPRDLVRSVENSLRRLGLDHVDLALVHWPSRDVPLAHTIAAMNQVADRGLARHIGVSNFTVALLDQAVALSEHPIVCNQVEYHPYLSQDRVLAACRRHGVALVSYCPLGRAGGLLAEPAIAAAARAHGRSPAQVVLRWHLQQPGVGAIPRSSSPARIRENLDVFGFALTGAEMAAIDALKARGQRICDFAFSPDWDPA
ncbi:MAG: oxidoreductase [Alphaproteobacteria bacterium]|nr:MAG: oxidoreductase [Alphaproteobacteria bacterium]